MMMIAVEAEDENCDELRRRGYKVEIDPASVKAAYSRIPGSYGSMVKGRYHFLDQLTLLHHIEQGTPYFQARAAAILDLGNGEWCATVDLYNISNTVSSRSDLYLNGYNKKGSALLLRSEYDGLELMEKKRKFITTFLLGYHMEVMKVWDKNAIYWTMLTPDSFMDVPGKLVCSKSFLEYLKTTKNDQRISG